MAHPRKQSSHAVPQIPSRLARVMFSRPPTGNTGCLFGLPLALLLAMSLGVAWPLGLGPGLSLLLGMSLGSGVGLSLQLVPGLGYMPALYTFSGARSEKTSYY